MLRPVELNTTRNPRSRQPYKSRFDDMIVINEMALLYLVISHLYTSTKFWQYHDLEIFIFYPDGFPLLIHLLIRNRLNDRVRINHTTRSLIDTLFQEHRVLLRLSHLICWNRHYFSPSFYHLTFLSFYFFTNSCSNCSKVFPFVSGQRRRRKTKAQQQIAL